MLAERIKNDLSWEQDFQKRFIGFLKKSPVLITVQTKIQNGQKGTLLKHNNSGLTYFFPFNYTQNCKDYISDIKNLLVKFHYPRLIEEVYINTETTPEEAALLMEQGKNIKEISKFQVKKIGQRTFLIDKVLLWKSIFILKIEGSTFDEDVIGESWRYKFNGSGMLFLKNYRNNKWGSIEEASNYFFSHSLLVDHIIEKNAQELQ